MLITAARGQSQAKGSSAARVGYLKTTQSKRRKSGGATRKAASTVDQPALDIILEEHVKEAGVDATFQLGVYLNLPISRAVRGHALAIDAKMLNKLLVLSPDGVINQKPARCTRSTCMEFPRTGTEERCCQMGC